MDHIPAPAVAGNCANCNHPTDQHHPRCPTRPYSGKHERFPTEPVPAAYPQYESKDCPLCNGTFIHRPGYCPNHLPSLFDQQPADLTYAKAKAKALIAEFEIWVNSPGVVWDDAASGAWMGQACTILAELAK